MKNITMRVANKEFTIIDSVCQRAKHLHDKDSTDFTKMITNARSEDPEKLKTEI